jgi:epidermal growth factor receptor substrate 15
MQLRALDALILFQPTPAETSLVDRVLEIGDLHGRGSISIHAAHKILSGSGLPPETLDAIYDIANVEENEMFSRYCIGVAVRLIGHAQKGTPISEALVTKGMFSLSEPNFSLSHKQ